MLSGDGNTVAIAAHSDSVSGRGVASTPTEGAHGSGAVHVFVRESGAWVKRLFVKATNTGSSDYFGDSVALSGDATTLAVGAPEEDSSSSGVGAVSDEAAENSGAAYVYQ